MAKGTAGWVSTILGVASMYFTGTPYAGYLAAGAMVGAVVENDYQTRKLKAQFDKMGNSQFAGSPSYSWGGVQTVSNPSLPVPLAFGTAATGGNIINAWTETINIYETKWEVDTTYSIISDTGKVKVIRVPITRGVTLGFPYLVHLTAVSEATLMIVNPENNLYESQWDIEITQASDSYLLTKIRYRRTGDLDWIDLGAISAYIDGSTFVLKIAKENPTDSTNIAGSKDYQYLVLGLAKGEISSIGNVKLNNNLINKYSSIHYIEEKRYGTNEQPPIEWAEQVVTEKSLNYHLLSNVVTPQGGETTVNNNVIAVVLVFNFAQGLYKIDSDGVYQAWRVDLQVGYRLTNSGADFTLLPVKSIIGKNINPFKNSIKFPLIKGKYDIRVTKTSLDEAPTGSPVTVGDVYWSVLQEYISEPLSYPNTAIAVYRLLATDSMSGSVPQFYFELDGLIVDVPNLTIASETQKYENCYWDGTNYKLGTTTCVDTGTFVKQWTRNPIWCVRYLCLSYDGLGEYISSMTDSELRILAKYCDTRVDNGSGVGTTEERLEKRFQLDGILDSQGDARNWLETILQHFRGYFVWSEGKIKLKIFKPETPVQLFTMGNIIADSLVINYASAQDKFNAVKVQHADKENDYKLTDIYIYDTTSTAPTKIIDITLPMITRRSQAVRMGRFILNKNKYITESVQFNAAIDAIACEAGDVIEFAHDVCGYGLLSGRIKASTINTVTLDAQITLASATYKIKVRLTDDTIEERTISNGAGTYYTISTTTNFSSIPPVDSVYSVGESGKVSKPYRVINISRSNNQERKIVAIEENDSIYTDSGDNVVQVIYSHLENPLAIPASVINLTLKEVTYDPGDGTKINHVLVAWSAPDDKNYDRAKIYISDSAGAFWELKGEGRGSFVLNNLNKVSLTVAVASVSKYGIAQTISDAAKATLVISGDTVPPANTTFKDANYLTLSGANFTLDSPTAAQATLGDDKNFIYGVDLNWYPVYDSDLAGYEIRLENANWGTDSANRLYTGMSTHLHYENPNIASFTFWVKAYDKSGNYSLVAGGIAIGNSPPSMSDVYSDFTGKDCHIWWQAVQDNDFLEYQVYIYSDSGRTKLIRFDRMTNPDYYYTYEYNVQDNGLPGIRYLYFTVKAIDSLNQSGYKDVYVFNVAPPAPNQLKAENFTDYVRLTWNIVNDVDLKGYDIYVNGNKIDFTTDNFYSHHGLGGVTYNYYVKAVDSFGEGNQSLTVQGTPTGPLIDIIAPAIPTGLTASTVNVIMPDGTSVTSINATCNANTESDLIGYNFRIKEGTGNFGEYFFTNTNAYTWAAGVKAGITYTIGVQAVDTSGNKSGWTPDYTIVAAPDNIPPGPISNLTAFGGFNFIALNWTNPADTDMAGIEIWRSNSNNRANATKIVDGKSNWYHDEVNEYLNSPSSGQLSQSGITFFDATLICNGNTTDNAWHTDSSVAGAYIQIDLGAGSDRAFVKARIYAKGSNAGQYAIKYSDDSTAYTAVTTVGNGLNVTGGAGWYSISWDNADKHRYWRLELENTPGSGAYLAELEMYDTARYYWGRPKDTSGNLGTWYPVSTTAGITANTAFLNATNLITAGTVITRSAMIKDAIITNAHILNLNASKIDAGDIATARLQVNAGNAVNAGSVSITPGQILISGSRTLADWRHGSDLTKIDGGDIYANSITANLITIGNRNIKISGIEFTAIPSTNQLLWTAGTIDYINSAGVATSEAISSGSFTWPGGGATSYVWWTPVLGAFSWTTSAPIAMQDDRVVIAMYKGGTDLTVDIGRTIIDGAKIRTGSITAAQIAAGSITTDRLTAGTISSWTINASTINSSVFRTATSGKRIDINGDTANELSFFGDRGDGTVEKLAGIGIQSVGNDSIIGYFGSNNTLKTPILANSLGNYSIVANNYNSFGIAIYGTSTGGTGVEGDGKVYGGIFLCNTNNGGGGRAPLLLVPSGSNAAPTHFADKGALWVDSNGILYINTSGSTTWQKVGSQ